MVARVPHGPVRPISTPTPRKMDVPKHATSRKVGNRHFDVQRSRNPRSPLEKIAKNISEHSNKKVGKINPQVKKLPGTRIPTAEEIVNNPRLLRRLAQDYKAQADAQETQAVSEFCMDMFRNSITLDKLKLDNKI